MREIGISPRFSSDKFVPLQTKQRYSTRDISSEVFLTLFFRGFVPFLSLADFVSRNKNLQVADLQRLKSCFGKLVTATTRKDLIISASLYNLKKLFELCGPMIFLFSFYVPRSSMPAFFFSYCSIRNKLFAGFNVQRIAELVVEDAAVVVECSQTEFQH